VGLGVGVRKTLFLEPGGARYRGASLIRNPLLIGPYTLNPQPAGAGGPGDDVNFGQLRRRHSSLLLSSLELSHTKYEP